MRVRSFGDRALLLECGGTAEVRAAYAEALRRREAGELTCTDLVPAARTLLLDGLDDPGRVGAGLDDWPSEPAEDDEGELVELPVSYDGPDLESVAEHCGLDVDEVVRAAPRGGVRRGVLRVRARFRLPHRAARGARGAAAGGAAVQGARPGRSGWPGTFTGVYPRSSPGGWQLIARTEDELWDVEREPPALLAPGTRVRFTDG